MRHSRLPAAPRHREAKILILSCGRLPSQPAAARRKTSSSTRPISAAASVSAAWAAARLSRCYLSHGVSCRSGRLGIVQPLKVARPSTAHPTAAGGRIDRDAAVMVRKIGSAWLRRSPPASGNAPSYPDRPARRYRRGARSDDGDSEPEDCRSKCRMGMRDFLPMPCLPGCPKC